MRVYFLVFLWVILWGCFQFTGRAPLLFAQDSDHDGLLDQWELSGYDADGDGRIDESLDEFGADPGAPDFFVEIDWMGFEDGVDALRDSVQSLATRISSVCAREGIRAHIDIGPGISGDPALTGFGARARGGTLIPYQPIFRTRPSTQFIESGSSLYSLFHNPFFFRPSRRNIFYYLCIVAQQTPLDVGTALVDRFADEDAARLGLRDAGVYCAVVYRRAFSTNEELGSTVLHELGHAFGLGHGGVREDGSWDNTPGKLNYVSVMNPLYQLAAFGGFGGSGLFDFSHGTCTPIEELSLDERSGMGPTAREEVLAIVGYNRVRASAYRWNIDWNGNGVVDAFAYARDINRDGEIARAPWLDHDDWTHLKTVGFDGIGAHAYRSTGGGEATRVAAPQTHWLDSRGTGCRQLGIRRGDRLLMFNLTDTGPQADASIVLPEGVGEESSRMFSAPLARVAPETAVLLSDVGLFLAADPRAGFTACPELVSADGLRRRRVGGRDRIYFADLAGDGMYALLARNAEDVAVSTYADGRLSLNATVAQVGGFPQQYAELFPGDMTGDGRDDLLFVFPAAAFLLACGDAAPHDFTPAGSWLGEIVARNARWPLHPDDRHLFGDLNGDGVRDWIVCRPPFLGVFLNAPRSPVASGHLLSLADAESGSRVVFQWGDFLPGGGKELVAASGRAFAVVSWTPLGPRVQDFQQRIAKTGFFKETTSLGSVFALPWGERDALAVLGEAKTAVLELDSFRESVHAVPLGEWNLWPCDDVRRIDHDADGDEDIFVAHGATVGLIEHQGARLALRWVYAWDQASGAFAVKHIASVDVEEERFLRGDANRDGVVDLSDVISILRHLFGGRPLRACPDSADANDSGTLDIADGIFVLQYLFARGPLPPLPGPYVPGPDPTADGLPSCALSVRP